MLAKDIMTTQVITLTPQIDIAQAAKILLDNGINGAPVVDEQGQVIGILCQSDLVTQQKSLPVPTIFTLLDGFISLTSTKQLEKEVRKISALTVADAMTPNPVSVHPETTIEKIAGLMVDKNYHTLPVIEEGKLVGIIGNEDILRHLLRTMKKP